MPNYDYRCKLCDHTFEDFLRMADRKKPCKKPCPKCGKTKCIEQYIGSAPAACDPVRIGVRKPDSGFKEVISKIKRAHPRNTMRDY
jgi:putative FmdB family regulatory protein